MGWRELVTTQRTRFVLSAV